MTKYKYLHWILIFIITWQIIFLINLAADKEIGLAADVRYRTHFVTGGTKGRLTAR